jgi:hypothetical protein
MWKRSSPPKWSSRSPYMAGGLGLPFEVCGPSSGSVTNLGRLPSVITERISRSLGLLAVPPPWSKERLAPQVWQVARDLDKVVWDLPRSLRLWIRSPGPLAGRLNFWQVGSTWQERLGPWLVGTHGYPCLTSPRSTCRRRGRNKVTSKWREDMTTMKSRRVHGDRNKKVLLGADEDEHQVSRE